MTSRSSRCDYRISADELQSMIHSFRVNELQLILRAAGRSRVGLKAELLQRALELVAPPAQPSVALQMKISEVYKKSSTMSNYDVSRRSSVNESDLVQQPAGVAGYPSGVGSSAYGLGNYVPPVPFPSSSSNPANRFSPSVPTDPAVDPRQTIPANPNVRLIRLPFFDEMSVLIKPTTLVSRSSQRMQETIASFTLTAAQIRDISYNPSHPLPRMEVQLRFALADTSAAQKDDYPTDCQVRLNDRSVTLPNVIPTNKPNVEPKRPSRPQDITSYCHRTEGRSQRLTVQWKSDGIRTWVFSVIFVRKVNSEILLKRLKGKGMRNVDHTKAMIYDKLNLDSYDSEIATTSLRVSLVCPLGKMRITLPAKVKSCNHLQCFDASLYLMMNEKRPTWACPVCDGDAHFDNLILDGYMSKVLEQTHPDIVDIELRKNGVWIPLERDEDNKIIPAGGQQSVSNSGAGGGTSKAAGAEKDTPLVSLELDDSNPTAAAAVRPPQPKETAKADPPPADEVLIDLTEDSDDDSAPAHPSGTAAIRKVSTASSNSPQATPPPSATAVGAEDSCVIILDSPTNPTPEDPVTGPGSVPMGHDSDESALLRQFSFGSGGLAGNTPTPNASESRDQCPSGNTAGEAPQQQRTLRSSSPAAKRMAFSSKAPTHPPPPPAHTGPVTSYAAHGASGMISPTGQPGIIGGNNSGGFSMPGLTRALASSSYGDNSGGPMGAAGHGATGGSAFSSMFANASFYQKIAQQAFNLDAVSGFSSLMGNPMLAAAAAYANDPMQQRAATQAAASLMGSMGGAGFNQRAAAAGPPPLRFGPTQAIVTPPMGGSSGSGGLMGSSVSGSGGQLGSPKAAGASGSNASSTLSSSRISQIAPHSTIPQYSAAMNIAALNQGTQYSTGGPASTSARSQVGSPPMSQYNAASRAGGLSYYTPSTSSYVGSFGDGGGALGDQSMGGRNAGAGGTSSRSDLGFTDHQLRAMEKEASSEIHDFLLSCMRK